MSAIFIKLKDLSIDPTKPVDLTSVAPSEAAQLIRESYGFLADGIDVTIEGDTVVIKLPEPDPSKLAQAQENFDRGNSEARRGEYAKAIKYFKRTLAVVPDQPDARRNMAMAYLEQGNFPKAKEHLLECMRLSPEDGWTYGLLGNIAAKNERDLDSAEFYYEKGLSVAPEDNYLLNNCAVLLLQRGKLERARQLFDRALSSDPSYPNTYLGIAMLERRAGHLEEGLARLNEMFAMPPSEDIRSGPVYEGARQQFLDLCLELAERDHDALMAIILAGKSSLERDLGVPIRLVQDDTLQAAKASTKMAWRHSASEHIIKYKGEIRLFLPHILAHEMEHIVLESEARKASRNRTFLTTAASRSRAIRSLGNHVRLLTRQGYSEEAIGTVVQEMVHGVCLQLYNGPLDMYVESRLRERYPEIVPCQFAFLSQMCRESLRLITDKELITLTPSVIYDASTSMNCAASMFLDQLYPGKAGYTEAYRSTAAFAVGRRLFELWMSQAQGHAAGDEYLLVDQFADILGLRDWIEWAPEDVGDAEPWPEPTPTKFGSQEPEAVMFCLDALKRFERLGPMASMEIAREIALLGMEGIDYKTPGKTYEIRSLPGEKFTGLHLLCLMHVGLKKNDPSMETGLDLDSPYQLALEAHKGHLQ